MKKIAFVGGGLGTMTAVYHLMQLPDAKNKFDITIYQDGWRIGGKGASGVNLKKGFRVEEHGIHFWFGFYENGFKLMKDVYKALDRPEKAALRTFSDAFKPQPFMDFAQEINGKWTDWNIPFPPLPGTLGDGKFLDPIEEVVEIAIKMLAKEIAKILPHLESGCLGLVLKPFQKKGIPTHPTHETYLSGLEKEIAEDITHPLQRRLMALAKAHSNPEKHTSLGSKEHVDYLDKLKLHIWDAIGHLLIKHPDVLRVWCMVDFGLTVLRGVVQDKVLQVVDGKFKLDFSLINDYDFEEWLVYHGADKHFIRNVPAVKSMYDGPFSFFKGAVTSPNVEAGTALNIFFRLVFTCKEHIMWRMQAGMGDTVFTPIYQYLCKEFPENVKFQFFHELIHLRLSEDKKTVEKLVFNQQMRLKKGVKEYNPLYRINDLDCWPSEPLYEQLDPVQVEELHQEKNELTSDWSSWKGGEEITLVKDTHFDEVVIGASLASLPNFASELIQHNPKLAVMLDRVGTVQTQAFQLWLTKDPENLRVKDSKVLSTYVEPLDTYAEMNQILKREDWSKFKEKPKYILYVCGAMLNSETIPPWHGYYFPENQKYKVMDNAYGYIVNNLQFVLPGAFDKEGNFDWDVLYDPTGAKGPDRLKFQFFRSNIDTSERYVFSLKGSSRFRVKTDETGCDNLYFTGDWIKNGLNIGFVEGAVISGIQTARAVSGDTSIPIYLPW